jgi:hypothetical protein
MKISGFELEVSSASWNFELCSGSAAGHRRSLLFFVTSQKNEGLNVGFFYQLVICCRTVGKKHGKPLRNWRTF